MASPEYKPDIKSESLSVVDKTKNIALKVLGIALLAGLAIVGLKEYGVVLKEKIIQLKKFLPN